MACALAPTHPQAIGPQWEECWQITPLEHVPCIMARWWTTPSRSSCCWQLGNLCGLQRSMNANYKQNWDFKHAKALFTGKLHVSALKMPTRLKSTIRKFRAEQPDTTW